MRDFASYAKHATDAVTPAQRVYGEGILNNGRFLRDFLYQGFNADEDGRMALDGVLAHVAGAGRGSFNYRFAQPSRDAQPTVIGLFPHGHLSGLQTSPSGIRSPERRAEFAIARPQTGPPPRYFSPTHPMNIGVGACALIRVSPMESAMRRSPSTSASITSQRPAALLGTVAAAQRERRSPGPAIAIAPSGSLLLAGHDRRHGTHGSATISPRPQAVIRRYRMEHSCRSIGMRFLDSGDKDTPRSQRRQSARLSVLIGTRHPQHSATQSRRRLPRTGAAGRRRRKRARWCATAGDSRCRWPPTRVGTFAIQRLARPISE